MRPRILLALFAIVAAMAMLWALDAQEDVRVLVRDNGLDPAIIFPQDIVTPTFIAEDRNFYAYPAIASRITTDLARRITPRDPDDEAWMAARERTVDALAEAFTHDEILSLFIQSTDYGGNCIGIIAALDGRLHKTLATATVADMVTLSTIIRAPYALDAPSNARP